MIFSAPDAKAQNTDGSYFHIEGSKDKRITIPFELINNLVVIEARINDSTPLKFIVDTGVSYTLITSLYDEEVTVSQTRTINLAGLGDGEILQAYFSEGNEISIGRITGINMDVVTLGKDIFKLSSFMGTEVHGLMGYDLFANFAVEIDYRGKVLRLYNPAEFEQKFKKLPKHRKWYKYPIYLENRKAYLNVSYKDSPDDITTTLRLLIDTGSSNAFSFYDLSHPAINLPKNTISAFLGTGLSGNVTGDLGRVYSTQLGDFTFDKPVVAFPDSISIRRAFKIGDRHGSIGGEAFRRFKMILHYQDSTIFLRKNRNFNDDFSYNASGVEVSTPLADLPYYEIATVREGSPADRAGLQKGDVIRRINRKPVGNFSLNEITNFFHNKRGSRLRLEVQRNDSTNLIIRIKMEDELKIDSN